MYKHNYEEQNTKKNIDIIKTEIDYINKDKQHNIYIFGCSHTKSFIRKSISINNININNCYKSSVSLTGFTKEASRLNYKPYVDNIINSNIENYYLFKLGQVDVEYVYYYKKYKNKQDIIFEKFIIDILDKYILILLNYKKINNNILVCGLNLTNWLYYKDDINKHLDLKLELDKDELNNNIILFNNLLKQKCNDNNIIYFDLINETSEHINNIIKIKNDFIGYDYHYRGAECQDIYMSTINKEPNINNTNIVFLKKLFEYL